MNKIDEQKLLKCAKGSWQREILMDLIKYGEITNPLRTLRGKALAYRGHYKESLNSLLENVKNNDYHIKFVDGKLLLK